MLDKKEYKTINQKEKSVYIEENKGTVNIHLDPPSASYEELLSNITSASVDLYTYDNKFQDKIHIDRKETTQLYQWITENLHEDESNIALLVGNAGYGKTVILKDLFDLLKKNNTPTLGIKADKILNIHSLKDIETELSLIEGIMPTFEQLRKNEQTVVLLIDQIDALSQSLSSNRNGINTYDRLIKQLSNCPNVRIIISCRTYDLDYDPVLRSYKAKKIFRIPLLDISQVDKVLSILKIEINEKQIKLKEFLRTPLHLKLFCKVGTNAHFGEDINLQKLYDSIWEECIASQDLPKIIELLTSIAEKMHQQQHIVVDKRQFDLYSKELNFLLHQDLLKESAGNKIQFIHQTFFDYVYARTFISTGKSISRWLKTVHQGLFIRSQVKQLFAYLRDLDTNQYIKELKEVLSGDYRFHLKLLLLNDLGFYQNPLMQEKKLVTDVILTDPFFFRVFLESIQSPAWFVFIKEKKQFTNLLLKNDKETDQVITNLCSKIIWQDAKLIINFLENHENKTEIIRDVLIQIPESEIIYSYELYDRIVARIQTGYYYLEKALKNDPDFVISHLKAELEAKLKKIDGIDHEYIPGGPSAMRIYNNLLNQHPNKAIPYFLYVIQEIIKLKRDKYSLPPYGDDAFYLYRPNTDHQREHLNEYKDLYDTVLIQIKERKIDPCSTSLILNTLESEYANVIAIGVYYLIQNATSEIDRIYNLFTTNDFFSRIGSSQILEYYVKELLAQSYSLLTHNQQEEVNKHILSTQKDIYHWTYNDPPYTENKNCSDYLKKPYSLISMIPDQIRNKHKILKKIYQEGFRKYGKVINEKPPKVTTYIGYISYRQKAYQHMSFEDWKKSFLKLDKPKRDFDSWRKPSKEGNIRSFETHVSESPSKFYPFVKSLIPQLNVHVDYVLAGLEGLKKGKHPQNEVQALCLEIIQLRKHQFDESNTLSFLRILEYVITNNKDLDKAIFNYIKGIIYQTPDREFTKGIIQREDVGMDVVTEGINSTRGIAVELLVSCYLIVSYKEEIFETLEYVADTANEITRSCAIFRAAWLNNLDKKRAFDLYLRLVKDYNPYLLSIPFHDGHPLLYHMSINFKRLVPFFEKAIQIKEAGKPMSYFLFNAYINDRNNAFTLLKTLLNNNSQARQELAWVICTHVLNEKNASKGWKILNYLLIFDDKELGQRLNGCFSHMPTTLDSNVIIFMNKYVNSPLIFFADNCYYGYLRKLIPCDANQCLTWFFASQPKNINVDFFDEGSPLNVLIEAYNGLREYDTNSPILEETMDVFDSLLRVPSYRTLHMRTFFSELES